MRKTLLATILLLSILSKTHAQIEVDNFMGNKNGINYGIGFGAFIKAGIPVSEAASLTPEIGFVIALLNDGTGQDGTVVCPLKLGYRYTVNGSGTGFYVEPAVGFNIYGVTSYLDNSGYTQNQKFNGPILSGGIGYLFQPTGRFQFDLGIRYETVFAGSGNNVNYFGLRLTHNFSFVRRD